MGAQQSTGARSAAAGGAEAKTSYYELLGVERTATEDEIKKAYRRKALELHPDRNYGGDLERATALFAEIQAAHEVLSDPQERAWYDAHEGDILRGGAGEGASEYHYEHNMRVTTADDIARMLGKFRYNVEFTDAPTGFFGFVRETFAQLAKEEEAAADWEGVDVPEYPSFGHKDDTYEDVVRDFYAAWNGFATKKTFAWKDVYRTTEAPDRRVRRIMEKENKRFRDEGIREFNDAVRTLLQFVRRRDPRYTPNTQTADERAKTQRAAAKEQAARARAARAAQMAEAVPDWATKREPDEQHEEDEEDIEEEHYECVACRKTFKSEQQYEAHEKSKKHQKAVAALKRKMQKDNANLNLDEDITSSGVITPVEPELSGGADEVSGVGSPVGDIASEVENFNVNDQDVVKADKDATSDAETAENEAKPNTSSNTESDDEDSDYASRSDIEARLAGFRTSTEPSATEPSTRPSTVTTETPNIELDLDPSEPTPAAPKLGKAAQKRARKAAQQAELEQSDLPHKCAKCGSAFPSKTKLMQHLKDEGHAAPITVTKAAGGAGKKKGKKK